MHSPVLFLQSTSREDLFFITLPVKSIDSDYDLQLSEEDRIALGISTSKAEDLMCLALICLPDDGPPTANLLGPIVLCRTTGQGVQAIRDDARYSVVHHLAERRD